MIFPIVEIPARDGDGGGDAAAARCRRASFFADFCAFRLARRFARCAALGGLLAAATVLRRSSVTAVAAATVRTACCFSSTARA